MIQLTLGGVPANPDTSRIESISMKKCPVFDTARSTMEIRLNRLLRRRASAPARLASSTNSR